MLEKRILEKGLELGPLQSYIDSFKHGVSPHAGAGIGLDRVVFLYLGKNPFLFVVVFFNIIYNILLFYVYQNILFYFLIYSVFNRSG